MRFFLVKGKVQGVGFRYFAKTKAEVLGLSGFAANLPGGAVCIGVRFEKSISQNYHAFLKLLAQGPRGAAVEAVLSLKQSQVPSHLTLPSASLRGFVILS